MQLKWIIQTKKKRVPYNECQKFYTSKTIEFFIVIEMVINFNVEKTGLHVARWNFFSWRSYYFSFERPLLP